MIRLYPKSKAAFILALAFCHRRNRDLDRAIADFENRSAGRSSESWWSGGIFTVRKKTSPGASLPTTASPSSGPPSRRENGGLRGADLYREMGDVDKAIADFTEAIRHHPKSQYPAPDPASLYRQKKDRDRAIADYDELVRLDPKSPYPS